MDHGASGTAHEVDFGLESIEHLWTSLKKRILSQYDGFHPSGRALSDKTRPQWGAQACQHLIKTMPERIEAVIKTEVVIPDINVI